MLYKIYFFSNQRNLIFWIGISQLDPYHILKPLWPLYHRRLAWQCGKQIQSAWYIELETLSMTILWEASWTLNCYYFIIPGALLKPHVTWTQIAARDWTLRQLEATQRNRDASTHGWSHFRPEFTAVVSGDQRTGSWSKVFSATSRGYFWTF